MYVGAPGIQQVSARVLNILQSTLRSQATNNHPAPDPTALQSRGTTGDPSTGKQEEQGMSGPQLCE